MVNEGKGILGNWEATDAEIRDVIELAVRDAVLEHKKAGRSIVVWDSENDRIVILRADQILVSDDPTPSQP